MYTNRNPFGGNQFGNQNPFDDLLKKKKETLSQRWARASTDVSLQHRSHRRS